ncbi:MAG: type II toxin-antitoxin system VapC family toxin [Candidatus Electrothrix scaldis]|nr:MAG: type II toxin-antitoxin system VapC family toxin [Candidatus Electrothrix sp. GW3-3]
MISLKEASAYLETALFGVFYYQLITIFRIFGFLQHQMVSHLSQKDQLQDLGGIEILPVIPPHIFALGDLSFHHRDPFDRLLIAQANVEKAVLLSCDSAVQRYPVDIIW